MAAVQVRSMAVTIGMAVLTAGCATTGHKATSDLEGVPLHVVAAENFWGSIASQLGGSKVDVQSIITNPDTDPHDYDPGASDARAIADANVVIENGIGYDPWVTKLLAVDHPADFQLVNVGDVVKVADGGNPHRWYNPADVHRVVGAIVAAYTAADPADRTFFAGQQHAFETGALARYDALIADIKARFGGTPVGASESIVAMMAPALGLDLVTPPAFLRAISGGTDPTSSDKQTIDHQIAAHAIKVYIYNAQNATPDVRAQIDEATRAGIPITTITETLTPATATFQVWQVAQLTALESALAKAAGQ